MSDLGQGSGWRPLRRPSELHAAQDQTQRRLAVTPFMRLARVHALSAAGDGLIAVALAGSIFFSIDPSAARWRVALYLLLTIAPFAVVTPLIGPVIDRARSGRRGMIIGTGMGRVLLAFLMIQHVESILLFPEAFGLLVMQKSYSVAKSAVVPKLVRSESELVDANSRLALLSAISGMVGAAVGGVFTLGGPDWVAGVAMLVYVGAVVAAFQLPSVTVADSPSDREERAELRSRGILLAASAMGLLRAVVGFLTFLVAFVFRGGEDGVDVSAKGGAVGAATAVVRDVDIAGTPSAPAWHFGAVLLAAGIGSLAGARIAPPLRRTIAEERIIQGGLLIVATAAILGAWWGGVTGAFVAALAVAVSAAAAKLAFDAIVQRDAPEANHGRSFARFEARFQLLWAGGALAAVVPWGLSWGLIVIGVASTLTFASYTLGQAGYQGPLERTGVHKEIRKLLPSMVPSGLKDRLPTGLLDRFKRKIGEPAAAGPAVDPTWVGDGPPVADPTRADLPLVDPTVPIDPDRAPAGGGNGRDEWTEHEAPPPEPDPAAEPAEDQPDVLAEGLFQPWISSVDGVEVDPVPPPPEPGTTPERADEKREA